MSARVGYKVSMGYVPQQGSRAIAIMLNFNTLAVTSISDELFQEQSQGEIEFIQSVFIDNSANAQQFKLQTTTGLNQTIVAKANSQGYYPLLVPNGKLAYQASTTGNVNIQIIFMNIFVNTIVWPVV